MQRYTLTDFLDKDKFVAWLNQDGNPPTAMVPIANSRRGERAAVPVIDLESLDAWLKQHRRTRRSGFRRSPRTQKMLFDE